MIEILVDDDGVVVDGVWKDATMRPERIKIKGKPDFIDTVAYSVFGPVMYDESFSNDLSDKRNLAIRWTAHDPSNEGITFYNLNRGCTCGICKIKNFSLLTGTNF